MRETENLHLKLIDRSDKISDSIGYLNDNFETLDFANEGVIRDFGGILRLLDGVGISDNGIRAITLEEGYYKIDGLIVNGTGDSYFDDSIIYYSTRYNTPSVALIDSRYKAYSSSANTTLERRYSYTNNEWSLEVDRRITISSTDLEDGVSPLPTGSLYFVFE